MAPKRIEQRKLTGQLGVNLVERVVLSMGFGWHPTNSELEAGIDGYIEIRDPATGEATNCILQVQSRALKEFTAETDTTFEYLCKERDLNYWMAGNAPVLLIVSRAGIDEAYWASLKQYFSDLGKRSARRIVFDKTTQRFTQDSRQAVIGLAVPADSGIYFAPLPRDERIYSNLFRVASYPSHLHSANTDLRYPGQIWTRAKELGVRIGGEWYLKGKQLCSFHDLREPPWDQFCDRSRVETDPSDAWAHSADPDQRNDFVHLITRCLMEKLWPLHIGFLPDLGLFYFRATPTLKPRNLSYPSLKRIAAKTVFAPYASKTTEGRTAYYRHSAFEGFFRRLDDGWYLELTPTYYFSSDGRHISRFAAERLAGIKRLERNAAVLGQLRMWTACLTEPASLYDREYPYLKFDKPEFFAFEHGLDDEAWLKREDDDVARTIKTDLDQARLFD